MTGAAALARRLRRPGSLPGPAYLWYAGTGTAAAFLVIVLTKDAADRGDVPLVLAFFAATASGAALPLCLRAPITATVVQCAASAALAWGSAVDSGGPWPLTLPGIVIVVAQVGLMAVLHDWRIAAFAWWVTALACILMVALDPGGRTTSRADLTLVAYTTNSLLALLGGVFYRQRARIRRDLTEARQNVELEQSRRALVEERTRIARELHDVVAHSMSVIHMQATSARYRLPDLDDTTRAEFDEIAAGARSALGEMRQLLGVLRADRPGAAGNPVGERAPAPGFAQLPELVGNTHRRGTPTTLAVAPDLPTLPETTGTTVYRMVQEALSNAVRHAPGAEVGVTVGHEAGSLVVTVVNAPAPGPTGAAAHPDEDRPRHGLVGMAERAQLLGGTVAHGPQADGGFRVTARLPLSPGARSSR